MRGNLLVHHNPLGFRGVEWIKLTGKFRARIWPHEKNIGICLGYYDTAAEAGKAYDEGAREFYGVEARLNFPFVGERGVIASRLNEGLCPRGHDLSKHGYVHRGNGGNNCRKCNSAAQKRCRKRRHALKKG